MAWQAAGEAVELFPRHADAVLLLPASRLSWTGQREREAATSEKDSKNIFS